MEWFKHKTSAHNDPVISDAWDEFGDAGYVVWFVLLEIYGHQYNSSKPGKKLDVSKAFLRRKFRKSWTKVQQILNFYSTFGKIELEESDKRVTIGIPKFTEILSNWTKRQTLTPTESPTESPTAKTREDKDKDKKNTSSADEEGVFYLTKKRRKLAGKRLETFDLFWEAFNYKSGKAEAADAWIDIPDLNNKIVNRIIDAAQAESFNRKHIIENGKTPKMAQGWLSGRRWEDELPQNKINKPTNDLPQWMIDEGLG